MQRLSIYPETACKVLLSTSCWEVQKKKRHRLRVEKTRYIQCLMEQVGLTARNCWEHDFLLESMLAFLTVLREWHRLLCLKKDIRG